MAGTFMLTIDATGRGGATARALGSFALGFTFAGAPVEPLPACRFLTQADLENAIGGGANLDRLFDDNGDGKRDPIPLARIMRAAEDHALSFLLRNWTEDEVTFIGVHDFTFRQHVAFVALELKAETKQGFSSADGKGRFWTQYERAEEHFERLAKNKAHTTAKSKGAGAGANSGGEVNPVLDPATAPRFTFVPDRRNPTRGGY